MELRRAQRIASALVEELSPACERIEIAGSIRRCKPEVTDIELVAMPQYDAAEQLDLFDRRAHGRTNLLWDRIEGVSECHERVMPIKPGVSHIESDLNWPAKRTRASRYFRLWLPRPQIKVDLFMVKRETWGAIFTIRTGSARFSQSLVTRWTAVSGGGHVENGLLRRPGGGLEPTPEEEDVFAACGLEWISPELRVSGEALLNASQARE